MEYEVTYYECYSGTYTVNADSKEQAEEMVRADIHEGNLPAPENCYDSGCEATLISR